MGEKAFTLLYHPGSFFSQKAAFGLHEKGLKFEEKHVAPSVTYDTYEPWFMRINPKGQVPVLQHGDTYIADSVNIIQYLDDKCEGTKLIPDSRTDEGQLCKTLQTKLESIPIELLTFGTIMNPEHSEGIEIPQPMVERVCKDMKEGTRLAVLQKHLRENPDLAEAYQSKIDFFTKSETPFNPAGIDKSAYTECIEYVKAVLNDMETHVVAVHANQSDKWLCGKDFTIADICLAILLRRIKLVGLQKSVYDDGNHPALCKYYERLSKRDSFQQVCAKNSYSKISTK